MLAFVVELTATVVMVNVALDAPDATVTLAGTVALEELELNFTLRPPGPAGPLSVTVPVERVAACHRGRRYRKAR